LNNSFFTKMEKTLHVADFSKGHKEPVWEEIMQRLESTRELSYDELSDAAGGTSKPLENKNGGVDT